MKNSPVYAKKLPAFIKRLKAKHAAPAPEACDAITHLVVGMLEWNASRKTAQAGLTKLLSVLVDLNDLRVSHLKEVVDILGERYPLVTERVARLHDVLQAVFDREHAVTLEALAKRSKKDLRDYLGSLPGITPYAAARTILLAFEGHAVPLDDRQLDLLKQEQIIDPEASVEQAATFLEHHIKAGEAVDLYVHLRQWADDSTGATSAKPASKAAPASSSPRSKVQASRKDTTKSPGDGRAKK